MVEARDVESRDVEQGLELCLARHIARCTYGIDQLQQHGFSLADDEDVKEIRHRFGVERAVTAADDQGIAFVTVSRPHGHPGKVHQEVRAFAKSCS